MRELSSDLPRVLLGTTFANSALNAAHQHAGGKHPSVIGANVFHQVLGNAKS